MRRYELSQDTPNIGRTSCVGAHPLDSTTASAFIFDIMSGILFLVARSQRWLVLV